MPKLAQRNQNLGTETAFDVLARVNALRARGRDIVSFAIGEPDFDTPANVKDAAKAGLDRNETHYSASAGVLRFREAICEHSARVRGVRPAPDDVVVCPGAKPAIFFAILACIDPGDEVIYPNPGYPIYESLIRWVGATPVPLPLLERRGFAFDAADLHARVTDRTKMIILNSPGNPTGGILAAEDLDAVADVARRRDLWVLTDETYNHLAYDAIPRSIQGWPDMKERTIVVDGASKTWAMTGWRLGWGIYPAELAKAVARLVTNSVSCTNTFIQSAGVEALLGDASAVAARAMREDFRGRRDLIVKLLGEIPGVSCLSPKGAFYVFPNVTAACRKLGFPAANGLSDFLLDEAGVAVLPRTCFGPPLEGESEQYIRLSYATSRENIVEGLARMKRAIGGRS